MIADILNNKQLNPVVTELFVRGRKLNISLVFITLSYIAVPKNIRLSSTHYFIMEIPNKHDLYQIPFNHSSDIGFRGFMNLYKKCTAKLHSFFVIDGYLASDNLLQAFRSRGGQGVGHLTPPPPPSCSFLKNPLNVSILKI